MPVICVFHGIRVYMYFTDHAPPHIHVRSENGWAVLLIEDGTLYSGSASATVLSLVREWMRLYRDDLRRAWDKAVAGENPGRIAPPRMRGRRFS